MLETRVQIPDKFQPLFLPARYKIFYGGRGAAKSWNFARVLLILARGTKLRVMCTREIQNTIADSVHAILKEQIKLMDMEDFFTVTDKSIEGRNGSDFIFRGLKHNTDGLKSIEGVDICWVEEAQRVSDDSWDKLIPTIRKEGSEIWISFNTDFQTDPTWQRFMVNPLPNAIIVKVGYKDNPFFPETLRLEMEHCRATNPQKYRHIWEGGFGSRIEGKQVYPEFVRHLHVSLYSLQPIDSQVIRGWDNTGLSPACAITQIGPTGQWRILYEFCGEDIGILDFGEGVQMWCTQMFGSAARYRDIGDPAGKNRDSNKMSPADYLRKVNINVEDGIQTFKVRREAVAGRLTKIINGEPAILIDPGCTRIIDGFEGGYAYPEIGNTGMFKDEPEKNNYSHIHDALQYPATRLFIYEESSKNKNWRKHVRQGSWRIG
ncbi:MAG: PBSX family phage terminase large subunit [Dissulfurispiraceae bacterium]